MKIKLTFIFLIAIFIKLHTAFAQQYDSLQIKYNYINSMPQNAEVYLNDKLIGSTPARFLNDIVDSVKQNKIDIKLKNYFDYSFTFGLSDLPIYKNVKLLPVSKDISNNVVQKNYSDFFKRHRDVVPIVLSGTAALGSAITSFYFKRLANDNYDTYLNNGDRATLDRTRKYDIYSGVALAVMQVAFVSFIYLFLIK